MIAYHYSPLENEESIFKHGLLVPTKHPKLVVPVTCSEGHRNPHISLARTPSQAWALSGGFLLSANRPLPFIWTLYQVHLPRHSYRAFGDELKSTRDIPRKYIYKVGARNIYGKA